MDYIINIWKYITEKSNIWDYNYDLRNPLFKNFMFHCIMSPK